MSQVHIDPICCRGPSTQLATSAAGGVGFGAGLCFHKCQYILIPTDIGLVKVLLLAVVLWVPFSESGVVWHFTRVVKFFGIS